MVTLIRSKTREIDGVFYPDWGEADRIAMSSGWDAACCPERREKMVVTCCVQAALTHRRKRPPPLKAPTRQQRQKIASGDMVLSDGGADQVLGYSGKGRTTGPLRRIRQKGSFTIAEQWIAAVAMKG